MFQWDELMEYIINDYGLIWKLETKHTAKIIRPGRDGRIRLLDDRKFLLKRLVAKVFLPKQKRFVKVLDEDITNLKWTNRSNNCKKKLIMKYSL